MTEQTRPLYYEVNAYLGRILIQTRKGYTEFDFFFLWFEIIEHPILRIVDAYIGPCAMD